MIRAVAVASVIGGSLIAPLAGSALLAQTRALVVIGYGGRHAPVADADSAGQTFDSSFLGGAGLAMQIGSNTAIRGTATFLKSTFGGADTSLRRVLIAGDIQYGIPTSSGFVPYLFAGLGRTTFDPEADGEATVHRLTSRFGTGFNYLGVNMPVAAFVELGAWLYRLDSLGLDNFQFDLVLTAGLAYALAF